MNEIQRYNKLLAAVAGAGAQFLTLTAGCTDPRVHGLVAIVTAVVVYLVPNKE